MRVREVLQKLPLVKQVWRDRNGKEGSTHPKKKAPSSFEGGA